MYVLDVATDMYGQKHNTRLEFAGPPVWQDLARTAEAHFDREQRALRPAGAPDIPFRAQTMQVYDTALLRWVDLDPARCSCLQNGAQVYVFQPPTGLHSDAAGPIPAAKYAPETWLGSPVRARVAADAGLSDAFSERLRSVFSVLDQEKQRQVGMNALRDHFARYDLPWTAPVLGDYWGRTGALSYDDWVRFSAMNPALVDSMYYRSRGYWLDRAYYDAARSAVEAAAGSPPRGPQSPRSPPAVAGKIKHTVGTHARAGVTSAHPFKLSGKYTS